MNDDDAPIALESEALLYDYLKHLTSLCLFSLAGVAALADKVHGRSAAPIVAALLAVGLAAFSSFYATSMVIDARLSGKPLASRVNLYRHASPILLSVGIGMILYLYVKSRAG